MTKRTIKRKQSKARVTLSLPSDLVRRLDGQSRLRGASRSGLAARWLRAGERQASLFALEQDLAAYYAQPLDLDEVALGTALGNAARETAGQEPPPRQRRRSSR